MHPAGLASADVLFADIELVARIERAECRLLTDGIESIRRRRDSADCFALPIAGGIAAYGGHGSPFNKMAGLGFQEPAGPLGVADLLAAESAFEQRGSPVQVELSTLADPAIASLLTGRGYRLVGFENVLGRPLPIDTDPIAVTGVEISHSDPQALESWIDIVVTGFAHPDEQGVPSHEDFPREVAEQAMGDMAAADGFLRYLARYEGVLAGGASMRLTEGIAQLCGAATLPAFRRKGIQTALLARRLADASVQGCDVAVMTTLPGSKSQHNAQRRGFELLYSRAVLVREA